MAEPFQAPRREVVVPPVWRPFYEQTSIPAAVRVGDALRVTGHTGDNADGVYPEDVEDQTRQTFSNIAVTHRRQAALGLEAGVLPTVRNAAPPRAIAVWRVSIPWLEGMAEILRRAGG